MVATEADLPILLGRDDDRGGGFGGVFFTGELSLFGMEASEEETAVSEDGFSCDASDVAKAAEAVDDSVEPGASDSDSVLIMTIRLLSGLDKLDIR